jgi:hypothetical protein
LPLPLPLLLHVGGAWDEDDFICIHYCVGESEKDSYEFDYFEYTDEPKAIYDMRLRKNVLMGSCRIALPLHGGPIYVAYRRVFTSIAGKTLADVAPGEELKENDAVVTRENKALATSNIFQVAFEVSVCVICATPPRLFHMCVRLSICILSVNQST